VVLDVFAQHLDLGVVDLVDVGRALDLRDEVLGRVVLDLCLLDHLHVVILELLAQPRVEQLFLDLGVDGELRANLLRYLPARALVAVLLLLELLEEVLHLAMVRHE
jgi:hypothetical protein